MRVAAAAFHPSCRAAPPPPPKARHVYIPRSDTRPSSGIQQPFTLSAAHLALERLYELVVLLLQLSADLPNELVFGRDDSFARLPLRLDLRVQLLSSWEGGAGQGK